MANYVYASATDYFLPTFMMAMYPQHKEAFALAQATSIACTGVISTISGGILTDRLGQRSPKNYARICFFGYLIAAPFMIASTLVTGNFQVVLGCIMARVLFGELFWAPSMVMIQNSVP